MRKILGILVVLLLVFITNSNMVFADQEKTSVIVIDNDKEIPNEEILAVEELKKPSEPTEEEKFDQKLAQASRLMGLLVVIIQDDFTVADAIEKLEKFQTKDPSVLEKIDKDWMPALKRGRQFFRDIQMELEKFLSQPNFVPWEEIGATLNKYDLEKIPKDINRVLGEMAAAGLYE